MRTILILLDSVRRCDLNMYNEQSDLLTPNLDQLREDSVKFDNHFIGSAPCMPARRDIFTGRYNFLERGWGGIEPFDVTLPNLLKSNGIYTHMITDHTHYVEIGGENYLQQFSSWDIVRGQEYDCWQSTCKEIPLPKQYYGTVSKQYESNRKRFLTEEDYPTPKTFSKACLWLEENYQCEDFFLMVEGFDPHEPFDCPEYYRNKYEEEYQGLPFNWSGYNDVKEPPEAVTHLKNCYKATMTMADHWIGKLIGCLKEKNIYEDTLIIFTSDHGHLLGEHNFIGKNITHAYNELALLPLLIHLPENKYAGESRTCLTQNIDLMPTILDEYQIEIPSQTRGKSLKGILYKSEEKVRDACIYGWFGRALNVTDGQYTYFASPDIKKTIYQYCGIPTTLWRYLGIHEASEIDMGRYLDYTNYPVYKIPYKDNERIYHYISQHELYDMVLDPGQNTPIQDEELEAKMRLLLKQCMDEHGCPKEMYGRFGLENPREGAKLEQETFTEK